MLFTHRGLSGPSILQISSYWKLGDNIKVNLSPTLDVDKFLNDRKISNPKQDISIIVSEIVILISCLGLEVFLSFRNLTTSSFGDKLTLISSPNFQ